MGYDVPIDDLTVDHVGEHFRRIAEAEGKPVGEVLSMTRFITSTRCREAC